MGGPGGPRAQANRALTSSFRSLHIPAYLTDPYRPLRIIAYPCILLHTLTDPYRQCISLHTLTDPYTSLQTLTDPYRPLHTLTYPGMGLGHGGPGPWGVARGARTILGPFESFRGVWRAKCQYDKLWPMGYCSASTGPTVLNDKGVVGAPIVPALCAATRE